MTSAGESTLASNLSRSRVDYKTILRPEEFDVFSKLRQLRKELAQSEAVPVYALFTNEQLAQMVQRRCRSKSDLAQIEGIGDGKIEKYVDHLLPILMSMEPGCESNLQQRLAALTAFSEAAGVKSWRFRKSVLQPPAVNDP